ncbi:MAG: hypothetical protein IT559_02485 [Alphaproteobacteria bacterium]|nr:hypothetical protein [Alphaproteobacteria bacterium]
MAINSFTTGLQLSTALFGNGRTPLRFGNPYLGWNKDYQNHLISRNILAKAAQLVNDLEDARAAKTTLDSFIAAKNPSSIKPVSRGSLFNFSS